LIYGAAGPWQTNPPIMQRERSIKWRASLWLLAAALPACSGASHPVKANWLTDYQKACDLAKSENRPMLMEFTASDWSVPCQKMNKEVLDTEPFKEFADKNLVLFQADFTQNPPPSDEIARQNQQVLALIAKGTPQPISAYPTFIILINQRESQRIVGWVPGDQFLNQICATIGLPPYSH
jgi:thioredoxin-related protein